MADTPLSDSSLPADASAGSGTSSAAGGITPGASAGMTSGTSDVLNDLGAPSAGGEPAAQAAGLQAHPLKAPFPAPGPSAYRMPDDYATESFFDKTKAWVEANPGLAILAFAGTGLLVGRLVTALVPDPEPETLAERVEARARELKKEAEARGRTAAKKVKKGARGARNEAASFLGDTAKSVRDTSRSLADDVTDFAHDAADTASRAAGSARSTAGRAARDGSDKVHDLAETIADAVKSVVDEWVDRVKN